MDQSERRPPSEREWGMMEKVLFSVVEENRRQRRWGIFFKILTFLYLFVLLGMLLSGRDGVDAHLTGEFTAVVDVTGIIAPESDASADVIATGLQRAFEAENARAVLLRINSPGGSPVQSRFVYQEIRRLRDKYPDKKVYAAITDVGASGAYYIAAAADEIYADPASIVGSIGVIMSGFGFTGTMEKLGVERRLLTAGENKAVLDPFSPVEPDQRAHVVKMLETIHQQFIEAVRAGRGDRLRTEDEDRIFSGLFWTGEQALQLGLVDGLLSPGQVAREIVGAGELVDYTPRRHPLDQFLRNFGVSIGTGVARAMGVEGPVIE